MDNRTVLWVLALLSVMSAGAEDPATCPCLPAHLCPHTFGDSPLDEQVMGPMDPCCEPGTVHCCEASVSKQEEDPAMEMVSEHLEKEQLFMAAIENFLEKMVGNTQQQEVLREQKSIDGTTKNKMRCDKTECDDKSESDSIKGGTQSGNSAATSDHSEDLEKTPNEENPLNKRRKTENVFIVYADKPGENKFYEEKEPQIVWPTKEQVEETQPQESDESDSQGEPSQTVQSSEINSSEEFVQHEEMVQERNHQLTSGKHNLHKLFPKRLLVATPSSQNPFKKNEEYPEEIEDAEIAATDIDEVENVEMFKVYENNVKHEEEQEETDNESDLIDYADLIDEAGSEVDEIKSRGSSRFSLSQTTMSTEQPDINKPQFRPPPRHLTPQQMKTEQSRPKNRNVYELLRGQSKGRTGLPHLTPTEEASTEEETPLPHNPNSDAVLEEINIKVINDIMKTNYTGPVNSFKRPNSVLRGTHVRVTTTKALPVGSERMQEEEKSPLKQTTLPQLSETQIIGEEKQEQTKKSTEHDSSVSVIESRRSMSRTRGRVHFRPQSNNKLPPNFSTTVSMSQEQVFDTSKETPRPQDSSRKQQAYRRSRVRTQVPTAELEDKLSSSHQNNHLDENKPTTYSPSTTKRRLRFKPKSRFQNDNTTNKEHNEEAKTTSASEAKNPPLPQIDLNATEVIAHKGHSHINLSKIEDLDSSGSDEDPQQFRPQGRFFPPQKMQRGFRPMLNLRDLKIVGPIPVGFLDNARQNTDDIGLELPEPEFQQEIDTGDQFDNDQINEEPLALLPPVFPVPQRSASFRSSFSEPETTSLLPPVEQPLLHSVAPSLLPPVERPLLPSVEPSLLPPVVTPSARIMLDQHTDLTQIQNEFNILKSRYDILLNKYSATLNIYNQKYKHLLNSTPAPDENM